MMLRPPEARDQGKDIYLQNLTDTPWRKFPHLPQDSLRHRILTVVVIVLEVGIETPTHV